MVAVLSEVRQPFENAKQYYLQIKLHFQISHLFFLLVCIIRYEVKVYGAKILYLKFSSLIHLFQILSLSARIYKNYSDYWFIQNIKKFVRNLSNYKNIIQIFLCFFCLFHFIQDTPDSSCVQCICSISKHVIC